ncbi:MAG TPA: glycine cleavage system protein GcvH [Gemmatimonadales bacterium]|nr:glycine cleavage system protein GcvH [Gemmatimonadales bacterium]
MSNVPEQLRYTAEHEYVQASGDGAVVTVGITDYAQGELGDIVYVSLPKVGDTFEAHQSFGTIEAVKAVSELFMPVAGEVAEINEALDADPAVVNRDPYGAGWMVKVRLANASATDGLLDAAAYRKHIGE